LSKLEGIIRFRELAPKLTIAIEEHLPGDFSLCEKDNSTWEGNGKTVQNSGNSPEAYSCAWALFFASENSDSIVGIVRKKANKHALKELGDGLAKSVAALEELSPPVRHELSKFSKRRFSASFDPPTKDLAPPDVMLLIVEQAMRDGIEAALKLVESKGEETRADLQAASVVSACRDVFERRTGASAPMYAEDEPSASAHASPTAFVLFAQQIFSILKINIRVSSALRTMRTLSN
jgi:hypothetical protein